MYFKFIQLFVFVISISFYIEQVESFSLVLPDGSFEKWVRILIDCQTHSLVGKECDQARQKMSILGRRPIKPPKGHSAYNNHIDNDKIDDQKFDILFNKIIQENKAKQNEHEAASNEIQPNAKGLLNRIVAY